MDEEALLSFSDDVFFTSARLSFLLRVTIFSRRGRWHEASKTDVMKGNALPASHNLVVPTKKSCSFLVYIRKNVLILQSYEHVSLKESLL